MVAGKTLQHKDHIVSDGKTKGLRLLTAAVIYGANASGKSNLIHAINFAKQTIVEGRGIKQQIVTTPFRLDLTSKAKPSKFEFEIRINDINYNYGFTINQGEVAEEWLYKIGVTTQKMIFERGSADDEGKSIELGSIPFVNKKDEEFLQFVAKGTRPNQLFLTETISRNVKYFEDVYNWFGEKLVVIFPSSAPLDLEHQIMTDESFKTSLMNYLNLFNLGIADISLKECDPKQEQAVPEGISANIIGQLGASKSKKSVFMAGADGQRYLFIKSKSGDVKMLKLRTLHQIADSNEKTEFEMSDESDGTQRLIDLIPAIISLLTREKVFIIDELDRSLHPELSYKFVEMFLNNRGDKQSQLIVTTHESALLDLDLLRRDEIWFVEKNRNGASQTYSLEEFTPRYDKDVRRGYLLGRFGAIPLIKDVHNLAWAKQL